MFPQPQANIRLPRFRFLIHSLLLLPILCFFFSQHFFWTVVIPPSPIPVALPPLPGVGNPENNFTPIVEWFLYAWRPQPSIPPFPREPILPPRDGLPIRRRARVAIIIDDLGFVLEPTEAFWDLEIPLTFAVLPWGRFSKAHAQEAIERNQEVILHLPLEPLDPRTDPGPGTLRSSFSPEQLRHQLRANLAAVPGIIGVNNHMGSKGTQDRSIMELIMTELKKANLFFIDSLTIHSSIAAAIAQANGVPSGVRDVFLDGSGLEAFPAQIDLLIEKALAQGSAIGIAHTRPGVAQALKEALPRFAAAGIELVHVSALVK